MMRIEQAEKCSCLNPQVFANNNVKLHCFVTNLTLITLQGTRIYRQIWWKYVNNFQSYSRKELPYFCGHGVLC